MKVRAGWSNQKTLFVLATGSIFCNCIARGNNAVEGFAAGLTISKMFLYMGNLYVEPRNKLIFPKTNEKTTLCICLVLSTFSGIFSAYCLKNGKFSFDMKGPGFENGKFVFYKQISSKITPYIMLLFTVGLNILMYPACKDVLLKKV